MRWQDNVLERARVLHRLRLLSDFLGAAGMDIRQIVMTMLMPISASQTLSIDSTSFSSEVRGVGREVFDDPLFLLLGRGLDSSSWAVIMMQTMIKGITSP